MYTRTILYLANSRKISGRCIAGREVLDKGFGPWLRPVSARPTEEVSEEERRFKDGGDPQVLQVISVPLRAPKPHHHQTENHELDPDYYWAYVRDATWKELQGAVEKVHTLWSNGFSTYHGENDRIPEAQAIVQPRSLYLVRPDQLVVRVLTEGEAFKNPRRRVRVRFSLNHIQYDLVVTDPIVERQYLRGEDGNYPIPEAILCISLAEVYQDFAYKLVATLITPDRKPVLE
jgi:hypothetical protein